MASPPASSASATASTRRELAPASRRITGAISGTGALSNLTVSYSSSGGSIALRLLCRPETRTRRSLYPVDRGTDCAIPGRQVFWSEVCAVRPAWCICAVMDRLRRWRSCGPGGRAGARHAGVTALILFAAAVTLALLVAVLSHQAWPPVVVAILVGIPALYLAWLAVPGVRSPEPAAAGKPAHGRLATMWNPVELGVHKAIGGGPMPPYVWRPHDEPLRAVLDPAVAASRLVVIRGGSSTGKTRAAYEAVAARLADWQLDYPRDIAALKERLDAGIPARTVLWLDELRQYADADEGPAVLGRLADLLGGEGHLVITTMWPEHWTTYTAAARAGPGPATRPGWPDGCWPGCPNSPAATPPRSIRPAAGSSTSLPVHPRRPGCRGPHHDPVLAARPRRPLRRAGRAGHPVPSRCPRPAASLPGPAVIPMAKRSSPRRWTLPGWATPARCLPRCCWRPRSGT